MEDQNNTCPRPDMTCGYKSGPLPSCAPLATSHVPMQQDNKPMYEKEEALTRGTLFPGLDLPFKNIANKTHPYAGTPLGELMALQFVIKELQLYLDTHCDDMDAFNTLKETIALEEEARRRYVKKYGPVQFSDVAMCDTYAWLNDPWPWNFNERMGRN